MELPHGFKMPSKDISAVYHYHFHYIIDSNQTKEKVLTKVRSDATLRKMKDFHQDSDRQSTTSHQSWKRSINPENQKHLNKIRSFKSTSPTSRGLNLNLDITNLKMNHTNFQDKRGYMTPKTVTKRQRAVTNTTIKNRQQETQELRQNSFGSLYDQYLIKVNPQNLLKSSFAKKNASQGLQELEQQKQIFSGQQMKISMKQRNSISEQLKQKDRPNEYAYNLLKQECKYLRRTFLKHYIKNHLLSQNQLKK